MKKILLILLTLITTTTMYSQQNNDDNTSDRYRRGWEKLKEIDGEAGENVVNGLKDISPELSQYIIEYSFGDIYSLQLLDNRSKEVAAVASLIAQGAMPQLRVHLNGALNTGSSISEVKEIILQMSVYVGFPKCINAMNALKEVLAERIERGVSDDQGVQSVNNGGDRYKIGAKYLGMLKENQEQILKNSYDNFSPELVKFTIEYGYGDIFSRENLDKRYRQIATIAALTTLGNVPAQLKFHIEGGLHIGLTTAEINEIMLLMSVYAGFPSAINGTNILKEVVTELDGSQK